MCRKSPIRTTWEWKEGDFYAGTVHKCRDPEFNEVEWPVEYGGVCSEDHEPNYKSGCGENWYSEMWPLPRQDQLQEILKDNVLSPNGHLFDTFFMFSDFMKAEILRYHSHGVTCEDSFEILWLKCVHKHVYRLEWRQGEWISAKPDFNDGMKFKYL